MIEALPPLPPLQSSGNAPSNWNTNHTISLGGQSYTIDLSFGNLPKGEFQLSSLLYDIHHNGSILGSGVFLTTSTVSEIAQAIQPIFSDYLSNIKILLEGGTDPNRPNESGKTSLNSLFAVMHSFANVFLDLAQANDDANNGTDYNSRLLYYLSDLINCIDGKYSADDFKSDFNSYTPPFKTHLHLWMSNIGSLDKQVDPPYANYFTNWIGNNKYTAKDNDSSNSVKGIDNLSTIVGELSFHSKY